MPEDRERKITARDRLSSCRTEEDVLRELRNYLIENQVTVGSSGALAFIDVIAYFEALTHIQRLTDIYVNKDTLEQIIGKMVNDLYVPLFANFNVVSAQIINSILLEIDEIIKAVATSTSAHPSFLELQQKRAFSSLRSTVLKGNLGFANKKITQVPPDNYTDIIRLVRAFQEAQQHIPTFELIKREIERSKFMIPGYLEAYETINAAGSRLASDIRFQKYRDLDGREAEFKGREDAIKLLKTFGNEILYGAFAPAPQQHEVKEETEENTIS